MMMLIPN